MAETRTINLEIKDNVKSLKTQYREAIQEVQTLADTYGATSREAAEAAKRAAELKDRIEESKSLTDAFNPDAKFNALSGSIGGVLNGFQAYEGAMGLIGVESEALQETLLKVQSAMALSQGIQGALEAKDAFVNLGAVVKDAFGKMSTAGKVFAVTGVGLIITAVGALVANMDKLKEKFTGVTSVQNAQKEATIAGAKAMADATMTVNEVGLAFEQAKKGVISKEQALKTYNDKLGTTLGTTDDLNEAEKIYRENSGKYIKAVQARAIAQALAASAAQELAKAETAALENNLTNMDAAELGAKTFLKGLITGGQNADEAIREGQERNQKRIQELRDKAKKNYDALNKLGEGYLKEAMSIESQLASGKAKVEEKVRKKERSSGTERVNYARQLEKEKIDAMEDGMEKRIKLLQFELAGELSEINKKGKKAGELRKAIEARYAKEIEKVRYEFRDRSDRDEQINLETKRINLIEIEKVTKEELLKVQQELIDEQKAKNDAADAAERERIKQLNEYRVQAVKDGLQTISNLAELFAGKSEKQQKRAFQVQKAVNIANAVIDTYKAANTALASSPPPFNYIAMAAAITAGLVNVKKIASQQFQSSSSSSGGGGTPSAPEVAQAAPQFNVIGSSGINQLAQLQQQPVQAYVVSGEVTSAQALDRNRIQNATL